jgi:hypothetical protein
VNLMNSRVTRSLNPAHLMVIVYLGLAAAAVWFLAPPIRDLPGQLITFSARYASVLLSSLPFLVAAAIWTAAVQLNNAVRQEPLGIAHTIASAVRQPLPHDDRIDPQRLRTPVAVAASGALHPVTLVAAAIAFGINSGSFLFLLVFLMLTVVGAGIVQSRFQRVLPRLLKPVSQAPQPESENMFDRAVECVSSELYHRLRFAVLGLLVSVAAHVLIPEPLIRLFGAVPFVAVVAMVVLAFVLSIPPEVAPFAAALFFGPVSHGAVLAFVLVSAVASARATMTAARASGPKPAAAFSIAAVVLIIVLTLPIGELTAGALW